MTAPPGRLYARLADAVARKGSARSVYGLENTLSRRGLLTRADRRARELAKLGVRAGDLVALPLGNGAELIVSLLSCSKLGAVAVPLDPARGDRSVRETGQRLPLRAVLRRPRGVEAGTPDYGDGYRFVSRRRVTGSLLAIDVLEPPDAPRRLWQPPAGAELVTEARGIGGVARDVIRTGAQLDAAGEAAAAALRLHAGVRLTCAQPLVVPRFFDPVVLGWLASEAQLVIAEGPAAAVVPPLAAHHAPLVLVDSAHEMLELCRALRTRGTTLDLMPVVAHASTPPGLGKTLAEAFVHPPRQLLQLEELGLLAHRELRAGAGFDPARGVALCSGAAMQIGGHELLVRTDHPGTLRPAVPPTEPGAVADDPWRHTGYAGRFGRDDRLQQVLGRDDGLVDIEGRRGCLDNVEEVLLHHPRLTWVQAHRQRGPDGDAWLRVEYRATGRSEVDDLRDLAIAELPPFMVPRQFDRRLD